MVLRFFLSLFLLFPTFAWGAGTIKDIDGISYWTNSTTTPEAYAGYAGLSTAGECTGGEGDYDTCDSCDGTTNTMCNIKRAHANLKLRITFVITTGDSGASGSAFIADNEGNEIIDMSTTYSKDGTAVAEVDWSDLCNYFDSITDCSTVNIDETIRFGLDYDNDDKLDDTNEYETLKVYTYTPDAADETVDLCTGSEKGICDFEVFPGDEKVYFTPISDLSSDEDLSDLITDIDPYAIRVMFSDTGFAFAHTTSDQIDLKIDSSGEMV